MASEGHSSTQAPQSPQVSASTTALPLSFNSMDSVGHTSTQFPQPEHLLVSIIAVMYQPFLTQRTNTTRCWMQALVEYPALPDGDANPYCNSTASYV